MFLVDKDKNEAISHEKKSFQELGFKERKHLQEWICKNTCPPRNHQVFTTSFLSLQRMWSV